MIHLAGLRMALHNYLFAKHNGGQFLLRIEDTDQSRFVPGAIQNLVDTLHWAGLDFDEGPIVNGDVITDKGENGPYVQSRRLEIYRHYADQLLAAGHAYPCFCTSERLEQMRKEQELRHQPPGYDAHCRNLTSDEVAKLRAEGHKEVIRMKMPTEGETRFVDLVRGEIVFENKLLDDQVLLKSDGFPTYHLAVVVDDHLMGISHVIRGEEWIPSTPKHINLYKFFGWEPTAYAHMPLILKAGGGGKLSKRDLAASAFDYISQGYSKEALLNFIALLGWHPTGDQEQMTMAEMIENFDLAHVNKSGAIFSIDKLDWLNGLFIRSLTLEEFTARVRPYLEQAGIIDANYPQDKLAKFAALEQARIKKFTEIITAIDYAFAAPKPAKEIIAWKKQEPAAAAERLEALHAFLSNLAEADFEAKLLETKTKEFIAVSGTPVGENLWPLRVALSGHEASPGPFEIAGALGKIETLNRIKTAIAILKA